MWGSIIDPILSKYNWTLDYVLWEISYVNITMLQVDEYTVVSEEKKPGKNDIPSKGTKSKNSSSKSNLSYGQLISLLGKAK